MKTLKIALLGNPNTGKTTLFNSLCGTRQRTGNYPGVTVERREGNLVKAGFSAKIIDLPGVYSLKPNSPDETITANYISGKVYGEELPDLLLVIVDASNLKRNLYLLHQALESEIPSAVVLTMSDVAVQKGMDIDLQKLEKELGIPVAKVTDANAKDILELTNLLSKYFHSENLSKTAPNRKTKTHKRTPDNLEAGPAQRYAWADTIIRSAVKRIPIAQKSMQWADTILTHRVFGLMTFIFIMGFMFQSVYSWAKPIMDILDLGFSRAGGFIQSALPGLPMISSLLSDGIIAGAGSVIVFLPQIAILFIFVAVLEDSGYLARAAFMVDKLLGWTGLNGRSFIPLLSSFACAIPGIMSARVLPDERTRIATILVSPLIACSARLRVNILFVSAIIEPQYGPLLAGLTFFSMHILGLLIALPTAWFLNKDVLKQKSAPFILELPPYRMPSFRNIAFRVYDAMKRFTILAGTTIVALSVIIWALTYFPRPDSITKKIVTKYEKILIEIEKSALPEKMKREKLRSVESERENAIQSVGLEYSYLGRAGKFIEPVFQPLGFDWKISVGILAAFPAREVIISTLGIIYNLGADANEDSIPLRKRLRLEKKTEGTLVYTPLTVISLLIFFALCAQCMSTLVTIRKELNSLFWPFAVFFYMTGLAYLVSFLFYQGGLLLGFR